MNKRQRLQADVRNGIVGYNMMQQRPFTVVTVLSKVDDVVYSESGFAKAHWPDMWDSEYGWALAMEKAISKIARYLEAKREGRQIEPFTHVEIEVFDPNEFEKYFSNAGIGIDQYLLNRILEPDTYPVSESSDENPESEHKNE
jgi:hypothetical protein